MTELTHGLCLDLADPFPSDIELPSNLLKGALQSVLDAKPSADDIRFTR
jgi:hypothetical protein